MKYLKFSIFGALIVAFATVTFASVTDFQDEFFGLLKWESVEESSYTNSWFQEKVSPIVLAEVYNLVGKHSMFSNRNKSHLQAVKILKEIFLGQETIDDVMKIGHALRDHPLINPKVWVQAFVSAKLIRSDMQFLKLPSLVEIVPDDFIPLEIFNQAEEIQNEECLVLDESFGSDNGEENALWYFREDLMINSHHWFWHIYYGNSGFPEEGTRGNRRGELFYFMHHEILARYGAERMTFGLPRISSLSYDYVTPLEPYNSHLTDSNSGLNWTARSPNTKLNDIARQIPSLPGVWFNLTIQSIKDKQDLITKNVESGYLIDVNGSLVILNGISGIDILTDAVESSIWAINPERYAKPGTGFHNNGHVAISSIPDINNKTEGAGVMAATSASLRDPIFYRHHTAVENILTSHKNKLTPYSPTGSEFPLKWNDVEIMDLRVTSESGDLPFNSLQTFWNYKEYNFSLGLDLQRNSSSPPVKICSKHLDHVEFDYTIDLNVVPEHEFNPNVTVRTYLARRFDENMSRFSMEQQHSMFFALDQFPAQLHEGINRITRNSRDSTLTIPFEAWEELKENDTLFQNCGCGLPHHLLLPIGSTTGTTFDLFAMVTHEKIELNYMIGNEKEGCRVAPLWCGVRDEKYPTMYPMGYPFDRRPYSTLSLDGVESIVENLEQYVQGIPNMMATQIQIQHLD